MAWHDVHLQIVCMCNGTLHNLLNCPVGKAKGQKAFIFSMVRQQCGQQAEQEAGCILTGNVSRQFLAFPRASENLYQIETCVNHRPNRSDYTQWQITLLKKKWFYSFYLTSFFYRCKNARTKTAVILALNHWEISSLLISPFTSNRVLFTSFPKSFFKTKDLI